METSLAAKPKRGEIWLVNLDPTIGSEIRKTRPAVIISSDSVGILPVRLIAPITGWDDRYSGNIWHILINPDTANNLSKPSAIDVLQVRGIDTARLCSSYWKTCSQNHARDYRGSYRCGRRLANKQPVPLYGSG